MNTTPLAFVPNQGQAAPEVRMQAHGLGGTLAFLPTEVVLALPGADQPAVRLQFVGARPDAVIAGGERLPGVINVLRGNAPSRWRTGIPTYAALTYQGLYPDIDLLYNGRDGRLKGTYTIAAGGSPARIRWHYAGAREVTIDWASGDLRIALADGRMLTERAPIAWQDVGGRRVPVEVRYALEGDQVGFALGGYDAAEPLVIDPELVYSTYLGGLSEDAGYGIALDAQGNIYVTGRTYSDDFPANGGARATDRDVFVAKFDPTGKQLLYSTLIGGGGGDDGVAVAVSAAGEAVVTVTTFSDDFPLKNALLDTLPPKHGGLLKLDASGDLAFSTYLNADMYFGHRNVGLDQAGNIYLAGEVGEGDVGLAKFSPDGAQILAERSIGGAGRDTPVALAVSASGSVYVTGETSAYQNDFPTTPDALQPNCNRESDASDASCSDDAFVLMLGPNLETRYSSYLGGVGSDKGHGIAIDGQGNVVVVGVTNSTNFPTRNAVQSQCPDGLSQLDSKWCASFATFAMKLAPDGKQIVFSTYFSSTDWSDDGVKDVAIDRGGVIHVLGHTTSQRYPVKNAPQPNLAAGICGERLCEDAVITAFASDGTLVYSTYLGGTGEEYSYGIFSDANGGVWATGQTTSRDFPGTAGGFQAEKSLQADAFLVRIGNRGGTPPPVDPSLKLKVYLPLIRR